VPIYVYRCPQGHSWEELRTSSEGTQTSEERCAECTRTEGVVPEHGTKAVAQVNVAFRGQGFTPKFYPNRKGK
jgi:predicted nucleic acid-binding Zn ribbon protein